MTEHIKNCRKVLLKRYFFRIFVLYTIDYVQAPYQTYPFQVQS